MRILVRSGLCSVSAMAASFISGTSQQGAERGGSSVPRSKRQVLRWWVTVVQHNVACSWVSAVCFSDCGSGVRTWNWSLEPWSCTLFHSEEAVVHGLWCRWIGSRPYGSNRSVLGKAVLQPISKLARRYRKTHWITRVMLLCFSPQLKLLHVTALYRVWYNRDFFFVVNHHLVKSRPTLEQQPSTSNRYKNVSIHCF